MNLGQGQESLFSLIPKELILEIIQYLDDPRDIDKFLLLISYQLNNNDWVTIFKLSMPYYYKETLKNYNAKIVYYRILFNRMYTIERSNKIMASSSKYYISSDYRHCVLSTEDSIVPTGYTGDLGLPKPIDLNINNPSPTFPKRYLGSIIILDDYNDKLLYKNNYGDYELEDVRYLYLEGILSISFMNTICLLEMDDIDILEKLFLDVPDIDFSNFVDNKTAKSLEYVIRNEVYDYSNMIGDIREYYSDYPISLDMHQIIMKYIQIELEDLICMILGIDDENIKYVNDLIEKLPTVLNGEDLSILIDIILSNAFNFDSMIKLWNRYNLEEKIGRERILKFFLETVTKGAIYDVRIIVFLSNLKVVREEYLK